MTGLKIISLRAENVLRLRAIEIQPDGTLQVIGGRNAQGKSSVLNALWLALGGGTAQREFSRPIRDGEDRAEVSVDLGDLRITRTWTAKGSKLTVKAADGATYSSPQRMLDELVGRLSFDPLAFTRLKPAEQRDALLNLVDLDVDLDALDRQRKAMFDHRTEIGREIKLRGDWVVNEALPTEERSLADQVAAIRKAEAINRDRDEAKQTIAYHADLIEQTKAEIRRLTDLLDRQEAGHAQAVLQLDGLPPEQLIDSMTEKLAEIEMLNAQVRENNHARTQRANRAALEAQYEECTAQIKALDQQKTEALAAARMPIDGLGFDDTGVTYRGVPFVQASSAEQIRVSLAMAMALNPRLRVLRILDGSLLDDDTMTAIRDQVADGDYQLLVERVGTGDPGAIIIEDGEVRP